jgi:hypothetical protein
MDEKTNDLMTKMYAEMQNGFMRIDKRLTSVEGEITRISETVSKIEIEHGQKLSALFDGQYQNAQKLDRIEAEVKKHDEFIMKRIK